jgi:hypothetical protein
MSIEVKSSTMIRLVIVLLYCFLFPLSGLGVSGLPRPSGPYAIGRVTFAWSDPSRLEVMPGNHGEHREVLVHIYYPADPNAHGPDPWGTPKSGHLGSPENRPFRDQSGR